MHQLDGRQRLFRMTDSDQNQAHANDSDLPISPAAKAHARELERPPESPSAGLLPAPMSIDSVLPNLSEYALVIDARSPHEFADDHIPGAVNLPVVNDEEFAQVGIAYKSDTHAAYLIGAQFALRNIAEHIKELISSFSSDSRILVYCYRGGRRSRAWAAPLQAIGYETDVLTGGWKTYRQAVLAGLDGLPRNFKFRVVAGPTGSGKTLLLAELKRLGEQVLDLEGVAAHRGSVLGAEPGREQPTQKLFDGNIFWMLRQFDPNRLVWIEDESKKIGRLHLPTALYAAMLDAPRVRVSATLDERVALLLGQYRGLVDQPANLVEHLAALKASVGHIEIELWSSLIAHGKFDEFVHRLLEHHYDPSYERGYRRELHRARSQLEVQMRPTSSSDITTVAKSLIAGAS